MHCDLLNRLAMMPSLLRSLGTSICKWIIRHKMTSSSARSLPLSNTDYASIWNLPIATQTHVHEAVSVQTNSSCSNFLTSSRARTRQLQDIFD
jgi:hypothetical protein